MSDPRAFISYDFDNDKSIKEMFAGQAKNENTKFTIEDWSAKSSMPQKEWKALVETKMKKTNMCIVLVGKKMSTATGVDAEIAIAKDNDVPIFGVYVNGATVNSTLPKGLLRKDVVEWDHEEISAMITCAMKVGKNK